MASDDSVKQVPAASVVSNQVIPPVAKPRQKRVTAADGQDKNPSTSSSAITTAPETQVLPKESPKPRLPRSGIPQPPQQQAAPNAGELELPPTEGATALRHLTTDRPKIAHRRPTRGHHDASQRLSSSDPELPRRSALAEEAQPSSSMPNIAKKDGPLKFNRPAPPVPGASVSNPEVQNPLEEQRLPHSQSAPVTPKPSRKAPPPPATQKPVSSDGSHRDHRVGTLEHRKAAAVSAQPPVVVAESQPKRLPLQPLWPVAAIDPETALSFKAHANPQTPEGRLQILRTELASVRHTMEEFREAQRINTDTDEGQKGKASIDVETTVIDNARIKLSAAFEIKSDNVTTRSILMAMLQRAAGKKDTDEIRSLASQCEKKRTRGGEPAHMELVAYAEELLSATPISAAGPVLEQRRESATKALGACIEALEKQTEGSHKTGNPFWRAVQPETADVTRWVTPLGPTSRLERGDLPSNKAQLAKLILELAPMAGIGIELFAVPPAHATQLSVNQSAVYAIAIAAPVLAESQDIAQKILALYSKLFAQDATNPGPSAFVPALGDRSATQALERRGVQALSPLYHAIGLINQTCPLELTEEDMAQVFSGTFQKVAAEKIYAVREQINQLHALGALSELNIKALNHELQRHRLSLMPDASDA